MSFVTTSRGSSFNQATFVLLAATIGFGGGWLAHRIAASRMLPTYRAPIKPVATSGVMCVNDLASAESECPGAGRAIVANSPKYYRIERKTLKCLMSSAKLRSLQAVPRYEPSFFHQKPNGFRVFDIKPGSLAWYLGLRNDDVIRTVDSRVVNSEEDLANAYARLGAGNYASVVLQRKGEFAVFTYYLAGPR